MNKLEAHAETQPEFRLIMKWPGQERVYQSFHPTLESLRSAEQMVLNRLTADQKANLSIRRTRLFELEIDPGTGQALYE